MKTLQKRDSRAPAPLGLVKKNTNFRKAVAFEKRVAIFVWRLAHGCSYAALSQLFGVGRSTAINICRDMLTAWTRYIVPKAIRRPTQREVVQIEAYFRSKGLPGCIGAIDGMHVPIQTDDPDYFNFKGFTSILSMVSH